MFKTSFRRIYKGDKGYDCRPFNAVPRYDFNMDIVENDFFSFIIYGNGYGSKFLQFDNLEDLRLTVDDIMKMKCMENHTLFSPTGNLDYFVYFTPQEFIQDYLLNSWYDNNSIISEYFAANSWISPECNFELWEESDCKPELELTLKSMRRIIKVDYSDMKWVKRREYFSLSSPILRTLSNADQNSLNELLNELLRKTDAKRYSKNPMFGRF